MIKNSSELQFKYNLILILILYKGKANQKAMIMKVLFIFLYFYLLSHSTISNETIPPFNLPQDFKLELSNTFFNIQPISLSVSGFKNIAKISYKGNYFQISVIANFNTSNIYIKFGKLKKVLSFDIFGEFSNSIKNLDFGFYLSMAGFAFQGKKTSKGGYLYAVPQFLPYFLHMAFITNSKGILEEIHYKMLNLTFKTKGFQEIPSSQTEFFISSSYTPFTHKEKAIMINQFLNLFFGIYGNDTNTDVLVDDLEYYFNVTLRPQKLNIEEDKSQTINNLKEHEFDKKDTDL